MVRHVKDEGKVEQGVSCQEKAKTAFDTCDFEEAFLLYQEAEKLYREAYEWPGDRVFFMQASALRCLEELLDNGRSEFYHSYQVQAKTFIEEWKESEIKARLGRGYRGSYGHRIEEAVAFLLWRKSHLEGSFEFQAANAAIEGGDFEKARQILDEFVLRLEKSTDLESDALCAIARSKREILVVKEEFRKPENQRSIIAVADGYMRAAEVSHLAENSSSQQRQRIAAFKDWFLSCAFKFKGFAYLRDEGISKPIHALTEAEQNFAKAVEHARKAISSFGSSSAAYFPNSHLWYLTYWHEIILQRIHLMQFMARGDCKELELSIEALQRTLGAVERILEQIGEESIFPNRFYSLYDLKLERVFLDAAYAFRLGKWRDCVTHLERWRQELPAEYRWSWRDIQVYVRLLFAKAIHVAFTEENQQESRKICEELKRVKSEPIGNTSRFLVDEAQGFLMKKGIPLNDEYVNLLCTCFPLDSYSDSYQTGSEVDPLLSLPERVWNWLDQTRSPSTNIDVEEFKAKLSGSAEALIGYECDYHLQVLSPNEHASPPELDALIRRLSDITHIHWKKRKSLIASLESLKEVVEHLQDVKEPEYYKPLYEKMRGALKELTRIVPVVIEIKSAIPSSEEPKGIIAFPDWKLHYSRPGRERLFIFASPDSLPEPGWYYLPPEWRKGNRISYAVSEKQPLLRVRYWPQWEFWEREAANASLLLIEGVSSKHLERAIELAERCTPEDGRTHPKVGAVIVKDGEIISEAYRNEDDDGGHAEEVAMGKCKKEELRGATIITTLEPCITGRRPSKAPCANLIIQNQIQKVVIGIPDPDQRIRGTGELMLHKNDILVAHFPSRLSKRVWELNKGFIEEHTEHEFRTVYLCKK